MTDTPKPDMADNVSALRSLAYEADEKEFVFAGDILRSAADELENLREVVMPFGAFANAAEEIAGDPDKIMADIVKHKHQSLILAAFQNARAAAFPTPPNTGGE